MRDRWTRVAKRIPVPPGTKDAIMSVGLMGATGTLDFDGLTVDLIPVGGEDSTNLVVNGGFELGDPAPASWVTEGDARRSFPGNRLVRRGRANPREVPAVDRARSCRSMGSRRSMSPSRSAARASAARGRRATFFFLDELGRPLPGSAGGSLVFSWADSCPWRIDEASVRVPPGAVRAVLQFEKLDCDRFDPLRRRSRHGLAQPRGRRRGLRTTLPTRPASGSPFRRPDRSWPKARSTSRSCCRRPPERADL